MAAWPAVASCGFFRRRSQPGSWNIDRRGVQHLRIYPRAKSPDAQGVDPACFRGPGGQQRFGDVLAARENVASDGDAGARGFSGDGFMANPVCDCGFHVYGREAGGSVKTI